MPRKTRGEQRFAAITYSQLAEWTGLTLKTIRSYGARGRIPKHDLQATIQWVNERRRRQGLSLIGVPGEGVEIELNEAVEVEMVANSGGYDPQKGDYE